MFGYGAISFVVFFSIVFTIAMLMPKFSVRIQRVLAYTVAVGISLFYGLRPSNIGIDTREYIDRYNGGVITEDYIFSWFGSILNSVGVDASTYLFLIAAITSIFLLKAFKNFSGQYSTAAFFLALVAIMPYGVMSYVNIVRQGVSLSLILYGISLFAENKYKVRGLVISLTSLFIHKTTALIYIITSVFKYLSRGRYKVAFVGLLAIMVPFFVLLVPTFLSILGVDMKYDSFADRDTSESPYLIFLKLAWALLHFGIFLYFGKIRSEFKVLYWYLGIIILAAILTLSNSLVSSRILSAVDILIPAIYTAQVTLKRQPIKIGVVLLILYALVSPFIFSIYSNNF